MWSGSHTGIVLEADVIAVDPPWRQGNLTYWSRRVGIEQRWPEFVAGLIQVIDKSNPVWVYLKTGVPEAKEWIAALEAIKYHTAATWKTRYYAGQNTQIVASRQHGTICIPQHDCSKESTTQLAKFLAECGCRTAADPCAGKGKMLKKFLDAGMQVAGIELCSRRSQECAKRLRAL